MDPDTESGTEPSMDPDKDREKEQETEPNMEPYMEPSMELADRQVARRKGGKHAGTLPSRKGCRWAGRRVTRQAGDEVVMEETSKADRHPPWQAGDNAGM